MLLLTLLESLLPSSCLSTARTLEPALCGRNTARPALAVARVGPRPLCPEPSFPHISAPALSFRPFSLFLCRRFCCLGLSPWFSVLLPQQSLLPPTTSPFNEGIVFVQKHEQSGNPGHPDFPLHPSTWCAPHNAWL